MPVSVLKTNSRYLIKADKNITLEDINYFKPEFWAQKNALSKTSSGRGASWFIHSGDKHWVLRHYCRGGMVARFITDHYFWTGVEHTRAYMELNLLDMMQQHGLPVPRPVAAHIERNSITYQADIIVEQIPHSRSLSDILQQEELNSDIWQKIGSIIRRFHDVGIHHSDLNAHNILLDIKAHVFLIDFDKGQQRRPARQWQVKVLQRLKRSLNKLGEQYREFHYNSTNWQALMSGYTSVSFSAEQ